MRKLIVAALMLIMVAAASFAVAGAFQEKLPKCAQVKCRDIGCPADVLCVSGSKVVTCADICG